MRTLNDIYTDYCNWLVLKSGNDSYKYDILLKEQEEATIKAFLYRSLLDLCFDPENGLYYFCKFIIGDLQDIGYPKPFRMNKLLRRWDKLIKCNKKLAVLCARGHGKTVFFSQILTIYDMFLFRHRRHIIISASQEQACRILEDMKTIIENNEWLTEKKNPNKWASTNIGYNDGYVIVAGVGSEILGQHVDRIILDDVLRSDNKLTDEQIEDYIDMNLDPMLLNRNGQMILVGTPRREQDIFNTIIWRIKENPKCPWFLEKYPAILDYDKKIIQCPDRFTFDELMDKRISMGELKFAREYQLEFFSRETSLFPDRIVKPAKERGASLVLEDKATIRPPNWTYVMGVDVARSGSVSADYTVAIVLAYDTVSQTKQIVHFWREKGYKISEQAKILSEISRRFNNCLIVVETNNMGQDMVDELVDNYNAFVEPVTVGGRAIKEELIRFLISAFEHEQMIIPGGDSFTKNKMDLVESELSKFCVTKTPMGNEKFMGVGSHDDIVSSLALANKGTQIGGVPFAISIDSKRTSNSNPYATLINGYNSKESDLVKQIRMGIIK